MRGCEELRRPFNAARLDRLPPYAVVPPSGGRRRVRPSNANHLEQAKRQTAVEYRQAAAVIKLTDASAAPRSDTLAPARRQF